MYDTIVDVVVGEGNSQKMFKLHKGILSFYSGYFDKALNGDFEEAKKGVVKLPTENVDIFSRFVQWLYRGDLDSDFSEDCKFGKLFHLWVFADRREIPLMMNTCIDAFYQRVVSRWVVPDGNLNFIYDNTTPGSTLRRAAIEVMAFTGYSGLLMKDKARQNWPADALWDLVMLTWDRDNTKRMDKEQLGNIDTCRFHQHEEGVTCSKKRKLDDK